MAPGHDATAPDAPGSPPHTPSSVPGTRRPELETLTFHPRPDADGLVARLGTGTLVPPHPADAERVTPGEAWACTLAEGPGGDTVARLVARVEPAPRDPEDPGDPSRPDGAGGEAPSRSQTGSTGAATSRTGSRHSSPDRSPRRSPGPGHLEPDERDELERRRQELLQREEMLEAQLQEVRERILDLEDVLGR